MDGREAQAKGKWEKGQLGKQSRKVGMEAPDRHLSHRGLTWRQEAAAAPAVRQCLRQTAPLGAGVCDVEDKSAGMHP